MRTPAFVGAPGRVWSSSLPIEAKGIYQVLLFLAYEDGASPGDLVILCRADDARLCRLSSCSANTLNRYLRLLADAGFIRRQETKGGMRPPIRLMIGFRGEQLSESEGLPEAQPSKSEGSTLKICGLNPQDLRVQPISRDSEPEEQLPRARSGGGREAGDDPILAAVRAEVEGDIQAAEILEAVKVLIEPGDDPGAIVAVVRQSKIKATRDRTGWLATVIPARRLEGKLFRVVRREPTPEPPATPEEVQVRKARRYGTGIGKGVRPPELAAGGVR